jgi:nicotinamidase-related amidase
VPLKKCKVVVVPMKRIGNREIFDTIEEVVQPSHTALLIIDMQNDFAAKGGFFDKKKINISMMEKAIPHQRELLDAARSSGVFVVYTENTVYMNPDGSILESPAHLAFYDKCGYLPDLEKGEFFTISGTWGEKTVANLAPGSGEYVINKHRPSGFVGTNMDMILRTRDIETVVVTGCVTQGCVETTVRDAGNHDYYVVVPSDAVASQNKQLHDAALSVMAARWTVTTSEEITKIWKQPT